MPINLYGKEDEKVSLTLRNTEIELAPIMENKSLIHACNYKDITLDNVKIQGKLEAVVKKWSDGKITLDNVEADAAEDVVKANESFFTRAI